MKSRQCVFNGFLVGVVLALAAGCLTTEERLRKKEFSSLRVHLEDPGSSDHSSAISIYRSAPMRLNIDRETVLDERNVSSARVVDEAGGLFSVEIQFNRQGTWMLERASVMNKGKHMAIFSEFGEQARWLAAPVLTAKNSSGRLVFTPDATREEAERFVRGLNNTARKIGHDENWPFKAPLGE